MEDGCLYSQSAYLERRYDFRQTWYWMTIKRLHFMFRRGHFFYELPETIRALKRFSIPRQ